MEMEEFPSSIAQNLLYGNISRMLKIRLQRVGRKHSPVFRVVLTNSRNSTKSGKYIENLGLFDHTTHTKRVNAERVKYWLSKGAQPSLTLHNFLISEKIIEGKKKNALPKRRPIKHATTSDASVGAGGASGKEEVKKEEVATAPATEAANPTS